jgi:hypothetical protein
MRAALWSAVAPATALLLPSRKRQFRFAALPHSKGKTVLERVPPPPPSVMSFDGALQAVIPTLTPSGATGWRNLALTMKSGSSR